MIHQHVGPPPGSSVSSVLGRVLVVDDDALLRQASAWVLENAGYAVRVAEGVKAALQILDTEEIDAVITDLRMPGGDGVSLLRELRRRQSEMPVLMMTGVPDISSAIDAVNLGAAAYLVKPVDASELRLVLARLLADVRLRQLRRDVVPGFGDVSSRGLKRAFDNAMGTLTLAWQPIIHAAGGAAFGSEGLLRTREQVLPHPGAVLRAAERLGRLPEVGRRVRAKAAEWVAALPGDVSAFVNLHPTDLLDPELFDPATPLSRVASRVVLEITERAALDGVDDVPGRVEQLRTLGYRIAVDDLGAGYSGLTSLMELHPDVVKLDMALVRGVDQDVTRNRIISSMTTLCHELGVLVVAEGVETEEEHIALVELGCDLLQGYRFGRPMELQGV